MSCFVSINDEQKSICAAVGGLASSLVAGTACIGPLAGMALGISGLGWLSRLSFLTLPASILASGLVATALWRFKTRKTSCASRRQHLRYKRLLTACVAIVAAITLFEYTVIPYFA